ncbi:unnamed protein product [Lactuca saligna]|uniref:Uncharacterized protein n=1 Tax=Lactuca saligna TaxID=75948 RepID=A0AA35YS46_LACSI|nr:unnamed protein product [Lactuca saligna]
MLMCGDTNKKRSVAPLPFNFICRLLQIGYCFLSHRGFFVRSLYLRYKGISVGYKRRSREREDIDQGSLTSTHWNHYISHSMLKAMSTSSIMSKIRSRCLEEDEDNPSIGVPDDECHLFDREETSKVVTIVSVNFMQIQIPKPAVIKYLIFLNLTSSFSTGARSVSGPRHRGVIGDRGSGSISRESSSASVDLLEWLDQHISDTESSHESRRWSSQSHLPSDPKPLYRASSYPIEKH